MGNRMFHKTYVEWKTKVVYFVLRNYKVTCMCTYPAIITDLLYAHEPCAPQGGDACASDVYTHDTDDVQETVHVYLYDD